MLTAFNTALSGLSADSTAVSVVGNNIANLNTTGFKSSSVTFADVMSATLTADGSTQLGMGVKSPVTNKDFLQEGALVSTSNALDVAIQGQGFLIDKTAGGSVLYSRDGNLKTDSIGTLMNSQNEAIQGWTVVNGKVNTNAALGNIVVPTGTLEPAVATTNMSFNTNLDATAAVATAPLTAANATYSTPIQVFDSLGKAQTVTMNFWNNGGGNWTWGASVPAANGTTTSTGTLTFDSSGNLTSPASTAAAPTVAITGLADGAANMNINFNLYANGSSAITQYAQQSSTSSNSQDGSAPASVTGVSIGSGGAVFASLSNGKQLQIATVAVANFTNPTSLIAVGNNDYQVSGLTSQPAIGAAGTGGRGDIQGSTLESSTVDISTEFTQLMTFQNSYEANSRVITTANTLEQQTVNLIPQA